MRWSLVSLVRARVEFRSLRRCAVEVCLPSLGSMNGFATFGRRLRPVLVMLVVAVGVLGLTAASVAAAVLGSASLAGAHGPLLQVRGVLAIVRVLSVLVLVLAAFWAAGLAGAILAEEAAEIAVRRRGAAAGVAWRAVAGGRLAPLAVGALAGTGLGVVAGLVLAWRFTSVAAGLLGLDRPPSFTVPLPVLAVSVAAGLGVPLLAALIAVANGARAGKQRPGPDPGCGHARPARSIGLGLRELARHPWRTGLTVAALGLSGAVVLAVAATIGSASQILTAFFAQYHADVFVTTPAAPASRVRAILDGTPGVAAVERLEQAQASTPGGKVIVTATEPGTKLYRYHVLSGRRLSPGEMGAALVSSPVARASGLRPGGELTVTID